LGVQKEPLFRKKWQSIPEFSSEHSAYLPNLAKAGEFFFSLKKMINFQKVISNKKKSMF
jgi:hypothetical protein